MEEKQLEPYTSVARVETKKLTHYIDRIDSLIQVGTSSQEIRSEAELMYSKALELALLANRMICVSDQNSIYGKSDFPVRLTEKKGENSVSPFLFTIEFNDESTIINMTFDTPPILKTRAAS